MIMYQTDRLYLRTLEYSDRGYIKWFSDRDVVAFNSHGAYPKTENDIARYIAESCTQDRLVLGIFANDETQSLIKRTHIGNISLQDVDWINRSAEIAWLIGEKEYWNKGYATAAGKLMLHHAFCEWNLHRIWLGTPVLNIGMCSVARKLGFQNEGLLRKAFFTKEGYYCDMARFGILQDEYLI